MKRYGSTNWQIFAVPEGSVAHNVGTLPANTCRLDSWQEKENGLNLMRSEDIGNLWGFSYEMDEPSPELWVIRDTTTKAIQYVYESENAIDQCPIIFETVGHQGTVADNLPTGSDIVEVSLTPTQYPNVIEGWLQAASSPSWTVGTMDEGSSNETLLKNLFKRNCAKHSIAGYPNIAEMELKDMPIERRQLYILLWYRCLSSILMDHADQHTCVPLLLDRFTAEGEFIMKRLVPVE